MTAAPFDWLEGNQIVKELGSEGHLADRIEAEREARKWSQSELARQMAQVGCPIPQTAISKIETPQRGGRRAITVEEALAFARVFAIPFGELMLPVDQFQSMTNLRLLGAAEAALKARAETETGYRDIVNEVAAVAFKDDAFKQALTADLHADHTGGTNGRSADRPRPAGWSTFLQDVFDVIGTFHDRSPRRSRKTKTS